MKVEVNVDSKNIKHISVYGEINQKSKRELILSELSDDFHAEINISFFDANTIHSDLVEKIYLKNKYSRLRIFVFKRYLYSYLYKLGIICEFVERKSLKKSTPLGVNDEVKGIKETKEFIEKINYRYGYDYSGYQLDSITRRIKICMLRENIKSFSQFQDIVLEKEEVFENLFHDFSINTTEFFRDPEIFRVIRNKILPYLNSFNHIKIWCAGCSSGKEAYSIAIILNEFGILEKSQIYATDINPNIIEEAKNGLFPLGDIDKDITNYKKSGGKRNFVEYIDLRENFYKIKDHLKRNILFFQHSLIGSGSLNEFTLIMCRNVMIYFNPELQSNVLENFYNSLDVSGFLILGKSEGLILNSGGKYFTGYMEKERIYRPRM